MTQILGTILLFAGLFAVALIINYVTTHLEEQETIQRLGPGPYPSSNPWWVDYEPDLPLLIPTIDKKAYLASPEWNTRRKLVLQRDHYTCRQCGTDSAALDVHHLHYRNLGNEPLTDLVAICRDCHNAIHAIYGYSPYSNFPIA